MGRSYARVAGSRQERPTGAMPFALQEPPTGAMPIAL